MSDRRPEARAPGEVQPSTAVPRAVGWRGGASQVTAELQREASRRIQVLGLAAAGISCVYVLLLVFVFPSSFGGLARDLRTEHAVFTLAAALLSLGLYFTARSRHLPARRLLDIGLVYEVTIAVFIALLNLMMLRAQGPRLGNTSWVAIWIVFYPSLVPNSRWRVLIASLIAAMSDPLVSYFGYFRTQGPYGFWQTCLLWHSSFIAAGMSLVPAQLYLHLSRKIKHARELGNYQLESRLGRGGMGEVWRARHAMLARPAAIKIIRPDTLGTGDPRVASETLRRFEREARATASLGSMHSIDIYDFGLSSDGTFYYVMELLSGFDLETLVKTFGPLSPARTVALLRQVAHSLEDAHASGLIHRDIKPANIFVCRKGQDLDFVKVLDFGLVKTAPGSSLEASTQTIAGQIAGTPAFMAPEQALDPTTIDARADLYSLGCVAYWLLTGRFVFEAETPMGMLVKHIDEVPSAPSAHSPQPVPPELDRLVLDCLAKSPQERPADAATLGRRLAACAAGAPWTAEDALVWWRQHAPLATGAAAGA